MTRAAIARTFGLVAAALGLAGTATFATTSCSQTPTNVPVRTFQQAGKMDVVCMAVNDVFGNPLDGRDLKPVDQGLCAPVPIGGDGTTMQYHLYAVVTQTTPGTLAVVDLTNGAIVDEDHATPGVNFIPVGPQPTDVQVSPDAAMTFVTSADVDKPAIYGINNKRLLGDSTGNPTNPPLQLTDLTACALPQQPDALQIVSHPDGSYALLAMLRGVATCGSSNPDGCAKIAVIDPSPLIAGAGLPTAPSSGDGGMEGGVASDAGAATPGTLPPCRVLGATSLATSPPPSWTPGPPWSNGIPFLDGGINLADAEPPLLGCSSVAALPGDGGSVPIALSNLSPPSPTSMVLRTDLSTPLLYVADGALPLIHVIDVSDPSNPTEQPPLVALTVRNPTRNISVGNIAVSPPTHDHLVYLYAVDLSEKDLMVFDVTDPASTQRSPLLRPNAELNPNLPLDRIAFSSPVATVAFAQHDWQIQSQSDPDLFTGGVLCNPNPNAHPNATTFNGPGAFYRVDQAGLVQNSATVENFPTRLRGVFAFATLTNGEIMPIDVDDWDAPCRRPDPMAAGGQCSTIPAGFCGQTGLLDLPEPSPTSSTDYDEYHAPIVYQSLISESPGVTLESVYPVSAPHRMRSASLLQNDPSSGPHIPGLANPPRLYDQNGSPIQTGSGIPNVPLLLPTQLDPGFIDPSQQENPAEPNPSARIALNPALATASYPTIDMNSKAAATTPGVRLSYDDPTASIEQNWTITYEGVLPGTPTAPADMVTTDFQSLVLTSGSSLSPGGPANGLGIPGYCGLGIEDWDIGRARRSEAGINDAPDAAWTSDYVEIADDLLPSTDPYWAQTGNSCWVQTGLDDPNPLTSASLAQRATDRYNACAERFGAQGTDAGTSGAGTLADNFLTRDFPIIQAYADHLVLGRFAWAPAESEQTQTRTIVGADPSNEPFIKYAQCCFHKQASVKVRAGGEWLVAGQSVGLIHHVAATGPGGRCVLTCNATDVLKNGRLLDLPASIMSAGIVTGTPGDAGAEGGAGEAGTLDGGLDAEAGLDGGVELDAVAPVEASVTPDAGGDAGACVPLVALPNIGRNDPRAMRNPMLSFVMMPACGTFPLPSTHTLLVRDMQWRFQVRGTFSPLQVSIAQGSTGGVAPQSMRFIAPFNQLAVVDAEQQGLVLIDLNTLGLAHSPYF